MGNKSCCYERKKKADKESILDTKILIKKLSKEQLILKINEFVASRTGDIVFTILMFASATSTVIIICTGVAEYNVISGLIVSSGATVYYISEIISKNKLINIYRKELKSRT